MLKQGHAQSTSGPVIGMRKVEHDPRARERRQDERDWRADRPKTNEGRMFHSLLLRTSLSNSPTHRPESLLNVTVTSIRLALGTPSIRWIKATCLPILTMSRSAPFILVVCRNTEVAVADRPSGEMS